MMKSSDWISFFSLADISTWTIERSTFCWREMSIKKILGRYSTLRRTFKPVWGVDNFKFYCNVEVEGEVIIYLVACGVDIYVFLKAYFFVGENRRRSRLLLKNYWDYQSVCALIFFCFPLQILEVCLY